MKPMKFDVTRSVPFERRLLLSAILSLIALMATVLCIPESLPESGQRLGLENVLYARFVPSHNELDMC